MTIGSRWPWVAFVLVLLLPATSRAQVLAADTQALHLEEALRLALAQNFDIQVARNNQARAEALAVAGEAGYYPTVNLNGSYTFILQQARRQTNTRSFTDPTQSSEIEVYNVQNEAFNGNVALTYTVFDGLQRRAFFRQLQLIASQSDVQTRIAVENVVSQVVRAYYDVVLQSETVKLLEETVAISNERVRIAQARREVGAGSGLEALQSTVDYNADRSALLRQKGTLRNATVTLNELIGRDPRTAFLAADTTIDVDTTLLEGELLAHVQQGNRQLQSLTQDVAISEWALRSARGARWPRLFINGQYNFNRSEAGPFFQGFNSAPFFNQNYGPTATVGLSVPLFDGGRLSRAIQTAELDLATATLRLDQQRLAVSASIARTYVDYENNLELIALEAENADVARQNADVALDRFRIGSSTPLELREAQVAFVQAQSRLLQAQFNAKVAEVELLRLSGAIEGNGAVRP